jgi:hypothetical protein
MTICPNFSSFFINCHNLVPICACFCTLRPRTKETSRRRIKVTSSLNIIFKNQQGNRMAEKGWRRNSALPHPFQTDRQLKTTWTWACARVYNLSYIYLGSSVCLSSCHIPSCRPVIFLSSCHICGTLSYSLCFSNQTDQGDKTEVL